MDRQDRRRINPPSGGTASPVFACSIGKPDDLRSRRPVRTRKSDELRKIFLQTGLVPSASGSAYFELQSAAAQLSTSLIPATSSLKLTCTVHGPKPLPRSAPFSPHLVLTTHVKFGPFATRQRRGYIRDSVERDLGVHLETALRGVIIGERWPKSGVDIIITILEGEEDKWWGDEVGGGAGWGMMTVLAGCVTCASAAIVDAGIDCVDLVSGGVAALAKIPTAVDSKENGMVATVLDPCPSEHEKIEAACVVAYLQNRDEITELWMKGDSGAASETIIDSAVRAAVASRTVLAETLKETTESKLGLDNASSSLKRKDANMTG